MTGSRSIHSRTAGFSLVELMVAIGLSILLLGGVIAMFMSSRASYETNDRLSRIQETGRFALESILRDVRSAGFVGCARAPTYVSNTINSTDLPYDFLGGPVRGFQATGAGTWAPTIDPTITAPGTPSASDVLIVRTPKTDAQPLRLVADIANGSAPLEVPTTGSSNLSVGDIALAYSCEAQAYFQVTSFAGGFIGHASPGGTPGNASDNIQYAFRRNSEVMPVHTVVYTIRPSTSGVAGLTSLFRRAGVGATEELVEGVERMELRFGVDTNNDSVVDQYVDASAGINWANVYSVSVALLVRSLEQYGLDQDTRTYTLMRTPNITVAAPNDRHLREVFAGTASIRNRVPVN